MQPNIFLSNTDLTTAAILVSGKPAVRWCNLKTFWKCESKTVSCPCQFRGRWITYGMSTASSSSPGFQSTEERLPLLSALSTGPAQLSCVCLTIRHHPAGRISKHRLLEFKLFICVHAKPVTKCHWVELYWSLGDSIIRNHLACESLSRIIKTENRKNTSRF